MPSNKTLINRVLPHRPPMLMLSNILQQEEHSIHCTSIIEARNPFVVDGLFPTFGGLELLAQASGLMLGLNKNERNSRLGVIAQIKSLAFHNATITTGAELHIFARLRAGTPDAAIIEGEVMLNDQVFCEGAMMLSTPPSSSL